MRSFIIVESLVVTGFSFVLAYLLRGTYYVVPAAALFFFLVLPLLRVANDGLGLITGDDVGAVGKYLGVTDIILFFYAVYQIFQCGELCFDYRCGGFFCPVRCCHHARVRAVFWENFWKFDLGAECKEG